MTVSMPRIVLRLPEGLMSKVKDAAEEEDKLPTEYVRDLLRDALGGEDERENADAEAESNG